jgi:cytochrome c oxidase subunit 4
MKSVSSVKEYLLVYVALMLLLALTLGTALIDLGPLNAIVNLGIASVKAYLVLMFFMHLKGDKSVTRVFASAGVFWLAILFTLTLADYVSRGWLVMPGHWPRH